MTEEGGYAVSVAKSVIGSGFGAALEKDSDMFLPLYGDIIALAEDEINSPFALRNRRCKRRRQIFGGRRFGYARTS